MRIPMLAGAAMLAACSMVIAGHAPSALAQQPAPTAPALALAALDRRIADIDSEEQASKKELADLGSKLKDTHGRVVSRGRGYYRLTRAGLLPVGGGFDQLVRHALRVERMRESLKLDLEAEKRMRTRAAELASGLERVARDRAALSTQRTAMDAARLAMEDEQRRQAAFDRAFESSAGPSDYVAVYGASGASEPLAPSVGFAAAKGRLLFPVIGRAEVRATRREGTDGPGLEIRAPLGAPVRAVFAGRVAFADRYGPYGRIVILDHGDHYYTVSGNLAAIDVRVGGEVAPGERIGTVGDDGHGPMLYFEVRRGSQTVAPGPWLGL